MYGISTYIWLIFMVNVGKYTIQGSSGNIRNVRGGLWNRSCNPYHPYGTMVYLLYLHLQFTGLVDFNGKCWVNIQSSHESYESYELLSLIPTGDTW